MRSSGFLSDIYAATLHELGSTTSGYGYGVTATTTPAPILTAEQIEKLAQAQKEYLLKQAEKLQKEPVKVETNKLVIYAGIAFLAYLLLRK